MSVLLQLTEADFEDVLGAYRARELIKDGSREFLDGKQGAIVDVLMKVVAARLQHMAPEGFRLETIETVVKLGGTPFGVGLEGEVKGTFQLRIANDG